MNTMTFDSADKKQYEQAMKWITLLLDYNKESRDDYNEIHIYQEETLIIIEWNQVPYSRDWGGRFEYVDEDHVVMKQVCFPDRHYETLFDDEEEGRLKEWLEENPGWVKNSWGLWTNEIENERLREEFEKTVKTTEE